MKARARRGGQRKRRSRPTPRWLSKSEQIDRVAKARCLMLLSVLSGEKPVTEAIVESGISRASYYQMETRALNAMLRVLSPTSTEEGLEDTSPARRIAELEQQVRRLEKGRRRTQRLLVLTRKVVRKAPLLAKGRRTGSTGSGRTPSRSSKSLESSALSPMAAGVAEP